MEYDGLLMAATGNDSGGGTGTGGTNNGGSTVIMIDSDTFENHPAPNPTASVKNIISTAFFWIAMLSVMTIVIGGILYVTSSADETRVRRAKATIQYSVIGLIISLLAWAIVKWVVGAI